MNEYNFCDEIKTKFMVSELESATLSYRLNGFIYACGMDLTNTEWIKCISHMRIPYLNKYEDSANIKYNINFTRNYVFEKGNSFVLLGKYNGLDLLFINYYDEDKNKNHINEIPFHILLVKPYKDFSYSIDIETVSRTCVKFIIKRIKEKEIIPNTITFNANVFDFSKTLKLVKSFVYNPELVFIAYNEVMNRKEINFTNKELDVALVKDEKLDKPISKLRKKIKMIANND